MFLHRTELGGLLWDSTLNEFCERDFDLSLSVHLTRALENVCKSDWDSPDMAARMWEWCSSLPLRNVWQTELDANGDECGQDSRSAVEEPEEFCLPEEMRLSEMQKDKLRRQIAAEDLPKRLQERKVD